MTSPCASPSESGSDGIAIPLCAWIGDDLADQEDLPSKGVLVFPDGLVWTCLSLGFVLHLPLLSSAENLTPRRLGFPGFSVTWLPSGRHPGERRNPRRRLEDVSHGGPGQGTSLSASGGFSGGRGVPPARLLGRLCSQRPA